MSIKDLSPPASEPLDLAYAKIFLRVDNDDEDALIGDLITAARVRVEQMIRTSLITRRQVYTTDRLSDSGFYINHGPVETVHSVKAIDKDGAEFDLLLSDVDIDLRAVPAKLCLREPYRWRNFGSGARQVEVEFDAGYGPGAADVPMPLRQAVMLLLAQSYEHRSSGDTPPVPLMVDALLMPYRSLKL